MNKISTISNGVRVKVTVTENSVTGERLTRLQNRILTLTHSVRNDGNELIAYMLTDDTDKVWHVYSTDGKCKLTGSVVTPCTPSLKVNHGSRGIKILAIEKV